MENSQDNLHTVAQNLKGTWSLIDKVKILKQISQSINFLHQYKIIHRDIKPENFVKVGNEYKLTNFCFVKQIKPEINVILPRFVGLDYLMLQKLEMVNKIIHLKSIFGHLKQHFMRSYKKYHFPLILIHKILQQRIINFSSSNQILLLRVNQKKFYLQCLIKASEKTQNQFLQLFQVKLNLKQILLFHQIIQLVNPIPIQRIPFANPFLKQYNTIRTQFQKHV